ncbi:MAG TPA: 3-hydroxyacyl-CoA dehydrogenase NAD-binding domain-containing protein [Gemmatimonadales bacterium]|jgi:3-hydroxybutyryl-CoA dehydrogenase
MSKVAVVGAGTMGNGIAHVFAQAGWDTVLFDVSEDALNRGLETIKKNLDRQEKKGALGKGLAAQVLHRIRPAASLEAIKDPEMVVEAATENPKIKFELFTALDRLCPPSTVLASNTSSISIDEIARHTKRPGHVIGMHFMNPVPLMPLVEIVKGPQTSLETTSKVVEVAKQLGKTPVEVNDAPGFVSNRVLMPMINEAILCVQENIATPEAVDQIMTLGMKHPLGPLALADLIGLDVCLAIMEVLQDGLGDKYQPARLLKEMVSAGRLGRKSGAGFYVYRD